MLACRATPTCSMPAPGLELGRASGESVGAAYCEFILFFLVYTPFKI